jgi:hypothetical protein
MPRRPQHLTIAPVALGPELLARILIASSISMAAA